MPKILGGSLDEHRRQTRERLFTALGELMGERGFDGISLADITARAGIGRTAVYNHFADKEALLIEYVWSQTEVFIATLDRALAGVEDPVERLRLYIRHDARLSRDHHVPPASDLRTVLSPETLGRMREHAVLAERVMRSIIEDGIAAGQFAPQPVEVTIRLINACLASRAVPTQEPARTEALQAVEDFVMRAVGVRQHATVGRGVRVR